MRSPAQLALPEHLGRSSLYAVELAAEYLFIGVFYRSNQPFDTFRCTCCRRASDDRGRNSARPCRIYRVLRDPCHGRPTVCERKRSIWLLSLVFPLPRVISSGSVCHTSECYRPHYFILKSAGWSSHRSPSWSPCSTCRPLGRLPVLDELSIRTRRVE